MSGALAIVLGIAAACVLGWFINLFDKNPRKTPDQILRERIDEERRRETIRQFNLRLEQEDQERKREWRLKYKKYLKSPTWKRVRERVLEQSNYTCVFCGGVASQVHHRKYPRGHIAGEFKQERYAYLVPICAKCHMKQHDLLPKSAD